MARINAAAPSTGKVILLIDDQAEYLESTASLIRREGHEVIEKASGEAGLELLRERPVDLVLVDYFMPGGMNGEELVDKLRETDDCTQVILQTGYAGKYPPRELLKKLSIQGYHDKSDGPEKLLMWVDIGLKAAYTVQLLSRSRTGLRYILDITPELHKIQQIGDIFQGIIYQISGLIGIVNAFLAIPKEEGARGDPDGFFATLGESDLRIQAATGKFHGSKSLGEHLEQGQIDEISLALRGNEIRVEETRTIVPLRLRDETMGVIFLDRPVLKSSDVELLQIFANQAAVAIYNATLYEMASIDPLTGVNARRFFDRWLAREVRAAFRSQAQLALLMIDMDNLKLVNDKAGHLAGDKALSTIGSVLKQATRATDFVSRYGGDEFAIILPQASIEQAKIVTDRIFAGLGGKAVGEGESRFGIGVSIGACGIRPHSFKAEDFPRPIPQPYFEAAGVSLIKRADELLYEAKKGDGERLRSAEIEWPPFRGS